MPQAFTSSIIVYYNKNGYVNWNDHQSETTVIFYLIPATYIVFFKDVYKDQSEEFECIYVVVPFWSLV